MPYIIRPRNVRRTVAGLLSALGIIAAVPVSATAATCPSAALSHPFEQYGDAASYALVSGGSFESGAAGWTLNKAAVISEAGAPLGGSHALVIDKGQAVSPGFCVSSEYPSYRFFFHLVRGGGPLILKLRWTDQSGTHDVYVDSVSTGAAWTLSPVEELCNNLPLSADGTLFPVQLVFETTHPGLEYAIDDVYIDPYRR